MRRHHLVELEGFEGRTAAVELLKAAREMDGRHKMNALGFLLRLRGCLTDDEFHEYVKLLLDGGEDCAGVCHALWKTDEMLRKPQLTDIERAQLKAIEWPV